MALIFPSCCASIEQMPASFSGPVIIDGLVSLDQVVNVTVKLVEFSSSDRPITYARKLAEAEKVLPFPPVTTLLRPIGLRTAPALIYQVPETWMPSYVELSVLCLEDDLQGVDAWAAGAYDVMELLLAERLPLNQDKHLLSRRWGKPTPGHYYGVFWQWREGVPRVQGRIFPGHDS